MPKTRTVVAQHYSVMQCKAALHGMVSWEFWAEDRLFGIGGHRHTWTRQGIMSLAYLES